MTDGEIGFGPYMKKIASRPLLTHEEEKRITRRVAEGDKAAREELIERNVRLAINYAKKYRFSGLPFEDLVSEGIIGLHKAADRFDPTLGWKFSTYATWWIRQAIQRYVHYNSEMIRVPSQIIDRRYKIAQVLRKLPGATDDEIAEELGLSPEEIQDAWKGPVKTVSLDSLLTEDGGTFYDVIEDQQAPDPSEVAEDIGRLHDAMKSLTPLERRVVELRWGAGENETAASRNEVAEILNVTPGAVQKNQSSALEKLRRAMGVNADFGV